MKGKEITNNATRETSICSLPPDLLEEVLLKVLSASPSPIRDIRYFRQICKNFHATCSSKRVGKFMPVGDWSMYEHDRQDYLAFIQSCAECENLNARFILELEELFNLERFNIGLYHLQLAANQGHTISKYMIGLLLFREESSRSNGIDILNEASKNRHDQCIKPASRIFWMMMWKKWILFPFIRCEDFSCRASLLGDYNEESNEEQVKKNFCSEECKWAYEYNMFLKYEMGIF